MSQRLVLIQLTSSNFSYLSLQIWNQLNAVFLAKSIKSSVVASVTQSLLNKNIVLTTTLSFTVNFLVESKLIWKTIVLHTRFQKDQSWFKVIAHNILTINFNCSEEMNMIVKEIKTFNKDFIPISKLYWMSSASKRAT